MSLQILLIYGRQVFFIYQHRILLNEMILVLFEAIQHDISIDSIGV